MLYVHIDVNELRLAQGKLNMFLAIDRVSKWNRPVFVDTLRFAAEVFLMHKTRSLYSPEFRRQMVDLVRAGRTPEDLAREFEPTAQLTGAWAAAAEKQDGRREEIVLAILASERDELARLRRENKQLRLEHDILSKAAAWFARETGAVPSGSSGT